MSWNLYLWKFQLKSPLHVGFHKIMHFFRTRPYVPGKLLWAALTAKLTPMLGMNDYLKVGNFLKESFRLGYLFVSDGGKTYIPRYTDQGFKLGGLSQYEFEKKFISSIASAAIEPSSLSAEEGMLHEVEFISPYTIDNGKLVYLQGLFWIKNSQNDKFKSIKKNDEIYIQYNKFEVNFKAELANSFQVGGERKYGFGLLKLIEIKEVSDKNLKPFSGEWTKKGGEVNLTLNDNEAIWSHLKYSENLSVKGNIEPLVGREWSEEKGAGRKLSKAKICYVPGTTIERETTFNIGEYGIWFV